MASTPSDIKRNNAGQPEEQKPAVQDPQGVLPLALLAETAAGLLAGSDPYERISEFFQHFSDQLGLEIFVQYNVSEDGTHLELNSWAGFPKKFYRLLKRLEFGQAVCGTVAQTRQPMVVNNVQASTDRKTQLIRTIGINTYACHPLIAGGRLLGTLSFGSCRLSQFDEQTIYLLRTFCQMVAAAIGRRRGEEALAASERKYRELVKFAPAGIFEIDHRMLRFTSVNDAMVAMCGYSREELLQMDPLDLLDEPSQARLRERRQQWESGGALDQSVECRLRTKDGSLRDVILNTTFLEDDNGQPQRSSVIAHDITERKRTEAALRESEQRLALVFESLPVGVGFIDSKGKMILANQEMRRYIPTGIMPSLDEERYGRWCGYDADGRRIERSEYPGARALRGERILPGIELLYQQDDGSEIWTNVIALPIRDGEGRITGVISVVTDIDALKRSADALRQSERVLQEANKRFRSSIEALNEAFVIYSAVRQDGQIIDLRYEYVNGEACRFHNLTREQIVGHTLGEIFPGMKQMGLYDQYIRVIETGQPFREQMPVVTHPQSDLSGARGIFDIRASKFGDGIIVTSNDITERVRLETEHQRALQEQEIHRRLAEQRERERQSIARDLHDGPIQTLSALGFALQFLNESYRDPTLQLELSQAALNVRDAIQELRQVMYELRPPSLLRFGLAKSIQMHVENLSERYPQINWNLDLDPDGQSLPEQTCLALFRIYQEAINNVVHHSQASDAWIEFHIRPDELILEISDNGKGFENTRDIMELTRHQHFGLAGIAERAQALDGSLEIQSSPGDGTTIRVRVPVVGKSG